jgi:hypothetical protein
LSLTLSSPLEDYRHLTVGKRFDQFVTEDLLERHFYHLGACDFASRIDMVILAAFDRPTSEEV